MAASSRKAKITVAVAAFLVLALWTWMFPSALFATKRIARIEGCHLEESFAPAPVSTRTTDLVMDFVLVDVTQDTVVRGIIAPDEGVDRDNYRYACPAGKQVDVWWDSRHPSIAARERWRMFPWLGVAAIAFFAYVALRAARFRPDSPPGQAS